MKRQDWPLPAILALCGCGAATVAAVAVAGYARKVKRELDETKQALQKQTALRAEERTGRINAERRLRQEVKKLAQGRAEGVPLKVVAHLKSPFKGRCGTPRQGTIAPAAKGQIVFEASIPELALDSLEQFSHLWVIFLFHENTGLGEAGRGPTLPAKIAPPRLFGKKVGLFSTRSPHRPNPIGLTVVRLESVSGKVLTVSGVDMCHNTPILDVKPYIPYDVVPDHRVPPWVTAEDVPKWALQLLPPAEQALRRIVQERASPFYATYEDFVALLRDVLLQDVRSVHQGRGSADSSDKSSSSASGAVPYCCNIDDLAIEFFTYPDRIEVCRAYEQLKALPPLPPQEDAEEEPEEDENANRDGGRQPAAAASDVDPPPQR